MTRERQKFVSQIDRYAATRCDFPIKYLYDPGVIELRGFSLSADRPECFIGK